MNWPFAWHRNEKRQEELKRAIARWAVFKANMLGELKQYERFREVAHKEGDQSGVEMYDVLVQQVRHQIELANRALTTFERARLLVLSHQVQEESRDLLDSKTLEGLDEEIRRAIQNVASFNMELEESLRTQRAGSRILATPAPGGPAAATPAPPVPQHLDVEDLERRIAKPRSKA